MYLPLPGSPFLNRPCKVSWAHRCPSLIRNKGRVGNWLSSLIQPKSHQGYPDILHRTWPPHRKHCNPLTRESLASELRPNLATEIKVFRQSMQGEGRKCRVRRLIFELGNDFQATPGDFSPMLQAGPSAHEGKRRKWPRTGNDGH